MAAADPDALLFCNDAEVKTYDAKADAVAAMEQDFRRRGVPIDGVGLQLHQWAPNFDVDRIRRAIGRCAALGVQLHITELDVPLRVDPEGGVIDPQDLVRQAEAYRKVALACVEQSACRALQTWGFTDRYSWVRSHSKGAPGGSASLRSE